MTGNYLGPARQVQGALAFNQGHAQTTADVKGIDFRASIHHRSQWASISQAFVTSSAAYDMALMKQRGSRNHLGVGGFVLSDKAGTGGLRLLHINASGAYLVELSRYLDLSTGIQLGYNQRSIGYDGLKWDNQFNGTGYDPSIDHGENFQSDSKSFVDHGIGLFLHRKKNSDWGVGITQHHFRQNQSFL